MKLSTKQLAALMNARRNDRPKDSNKTALATKKTQLVLRRYVHQLRLR